MMPVRRTQNWLPSIFNDFFDNDRMVKANATAPAINVFETEKEYKVELAAPGMTKEDFNVHIDEENNLVISMEKKTENKEVPEKERADSDSVNGSAQIREHILNEKKQPPDKSSVSGEEKLTQSLNADFKERNQAFCKESCGAAQPDEENSYEPYQIVYGSPREQSPTIYRVDRLERLKVLDDHFPVEYASRFEEGELRKRIQFMYGGKLKKVRFRYHGTCPDYILDRLPTAKIIKRDEDGMLIEAEVFGDGIHFWMKGQGEVEEV